MYFISFYVFAYAGRMLAKINEQVIVMHLRKQNTHTERERASDVVCKNKYLSR